MALALLQACASADTGSEQVAEGTDALSSTATGTTLWDDDATDIANVTRAPETLDQVQISHGRLIYFHVVNGVWNFTDLGAPNGITLTAVAAANTAEGGMLDVFVLGSDQRIYHRFQHTEGSGTPDWGVWQQVPNTGTVRADSKLAATSWERGRIDLFWISASDTVGHATYTDWNLQNVEIGTGWLQNLPGRANGRIEAISAKARRLDVFLTAGSDTFSMHHHWKDFSNNTSGRSEYGMTGPGIIDGSFVAFTHAVLPLGAGQFALYVAVDPNEGQSGTRSGLRYRIFSAAQPNGSTLSFERTFNDEPIRNVTDGVRRIDAGVPINELWAPLGTSLWQVWFRD